MRFSRTALLAVAAEDRWQHLRVTGLFSAPGPEVMRKLLIVLWAAPLVLAFGVLPFRIDFSAGASSGDKRIGDRLVRPIIRVAHATGAPNALSSGESLGHFGGAIDANGNFLAAGDGVMDPLSEAGLTPQTDPMTGTRSVLSNVGSVSGRLASGPTPTPVPEPATGLLLASGLSGLVVFSRRGQRTGQGNPPRVDTSPPTSPIHS
jgi:hypothetical protein